MTGEETPDAADDGSLPEAFVEALWAYERHLGAERGHGPNTRRAYLGDARDLLSFAVGTGCSRLADIDLPLLRAWLAHLLAGGAARRAVPGRRHLPTVTRPVRGRQVDAPLPATAVGLAGVHGRHW